MVDPKLLCNQHLLGEHSEIHKHRHNFEKKHNINGRISPIVQIEPASMESRHNELVVEMKRRGMNHYSDYKQPDISYLPSESQNAKVNILNNLVDLCNRCVNCSKNINKTNIE